MNEKRKMLSRILCLDAVVIATHPDERRDQWNCNPDHGVHVQNINYSESNNLDVDALTLKDNDIAVIQHHVLQSELLANSHILKYVHFPPQMWCVFHYKVNTNPIILLSNHMKF